MAVDTPHIVITVPGLGIHGGGPSRTVPAFAEAMARAGVPVDLVTVGGDNLQFGANRLPRHRLITAFEATGRRTAPFSQPVMWGFGTLVRERLGQSPVSILHDNGCWTPANYRSAMAARAMHRPNVITIRGMLSPWALAQRKVKKRIAWLFYQRRILHQATLLHATSEQEADELRSLGFRNPIAIIPNGISGPGEETCLRPAHESSSTGLRTALFLSRIHEKKGLADLVRAWAQVRPVDWRVIVVGPDESGHQFQIEALARNLGVRECFEFAGPLDDERKWDAYAAADLFVLPTHSENFGVVIGEAMLAGLPVITTRRAPWRILTETGSGWWIGDNVKDLSTAIADATTRSRDGLIAMGDRARRAATSAEFTWESVASKFTEVYLWLIDRHPRPDSVV